MIRITPITIGLFLAGGCGGMGIYDADQPFTPAPHNGLTDLESNWLVDGDDDPIIPNGEQAQVYRFEFAEGFSRAAPQVMDLLADTLIDDLAVELHSQDRSMNHAILAATELETKPIAQDPCVPTQEPIHDPDLGKVFEIDFSGRELDLGQPFHLMMVTLTGTWNEATNQVGSPHLLIEADAFTLAAALYGANQATACTYLAKDELDCVMCDDGPCVTFAIDGFLARTIDDFNIEPLSSADVAAGSCY